MMSNRKELRCQERVDDGEQEDHGRHEIERVGRYAAFQSLPEIRYILIVVGVGGTREGRQISGLRGSCRVD